MASKPVIRLRGERATQYTVIFFICLSLGPFVAQVLRVFLRVALENEVCAKDFFEQRNFSRKMLQNAPRKF